MQTIAEAETRLAAAKAAGNTTEVDRLKLWLENRRTRNREKVRKFRSKDGRTNYRGTPEHVLAKKIANQQIQIDHWSARIEEEPSLAEVFSARVTAAQDRQQQYLIELGELTNG